MPRPGRTDTTGGGRRTFRPWPNDLVGNTRSVVTVIVLCLALIAPHALQAQDSETFASVLERQQRATFLAVVEYVRQNPGAADRFRAQLWVLQTALEQGFEVEALSVAEAVEADATLEPAAKTFASQVAALGLARSQRLPEALERFDGMLRGARFQAAGRMTTFARLLALRARLAGDFAAAREVFERLQGAFPLNRDVAEICENQLEKLDLIGKAAPEIGGADLAGKPVQLSDYAGKVVLIDFWGTNCEPCLEELPNLRAIYSDLHEKGLEIIGISFDTEPGLVEEFAAQNKLAWRMMLNGTGANRISTNYAALKIPSLYLVDRSGKIAQIDVHGRDLRTAIETLLAQP